MRPPHVPRDAFKLDAHGDDHARPQDGHSGTTESGVSRSSSITTRAPAFQFYPGDFLSDPNVLAMSMPQRGVYITLLSVCWLKGSLPNDLPALGKLCSLSPGAITKLWPAIGVCFRSTPAGDLIHPRLDRERAKQVEFSRRQRNRGKRGGRPRKPDESGKQPGALPDESGKQPGALPDESGGRKAGKNPGESSSVFSLQTSVRSSPLKNAENSARGRARAFPSVDDDDALAERAGQFIDRYKSLYRQHRKGAHYVGRPTLDYVEAVELVRTWDDDRLDRIATVFLTTDHRFAEEGSRTLAQFRALASWCDHRLKQAGL